jgi:hypothetical protein
MQTPRHECNHPKLTFGSGDFYLFCYGCGARWACIGDTGFSKDEISPATANRGVGAQLSGQTRTQHPNGDR